MPDQQVTLTRTQYEAFNLTFDAIKLAPLIGSEQYRVADPLSKVVHLFGSEEDGEAFIALLVRHRLFDGGIAAGPRSAIPCYVASIARWIEFVGCIRIVPDPPSPPPPPFWQEEKRIAALRDQADRGREELLARRDALARELADAEAALHAAEKEVAKMDGLLDKVRALAAEVRAAVAGPADRREAAQ